MRVAAVNWKIRPIRSETEFWDHLEEVVSAATRAGAELVVLPENVTFELLNLHTNLPESEIASCIESYGGRYQDMVQELGRACTVVGGSTILNGQNVGLIASPRGGGWYGKHLLTQYELEPLGLRTSSHLTHLPDVGAVICYDSEFPAAGRALAEAGVKVLAIPAYTETQHGFQRVRWCAQARATELQIFVVHASLVGSLGREPIVSAVGSSAILTPSHAPFPESATLDETAWNEEGIAIGELDFDQLRQCREQGDVRNWEDRDRGEWVPCLAEHPLDQA